MEFVNLFDVEVKNMFRYHQQFLPITVTPFELTQILLQADFRTSCYDLVGP